MRLPRPPRDQARDTPPEPTMPIGEPDPERSDVAGHVNERALPPRHRPLLMGQVAARFRLGTVTDPDKLAAAKQRREKSRRLLEGGIDDGVKRGYGVAKPPEDAAPEG